MRESKKIFPYFWHLDDNESEITVFRIYALSPENETVVLRINDFTPYSYLELPTNIDGNPIVWDAGKSQLLANAIDSRRKSPGPLKKTFMFKKRLYYCHMNQKSHKEKMFPYLLLAF